MSSVPFTARRLGGELKRWDAIVANRLHVLVRTRAPELSAGRHGSDSTKGKETQMG